MYTYAYYCAAGAKKIYIWGIIVTAVSRIKGKIPSFLCASYWFIITDIPQVKNIKP